MRKFVSLLIAFTFNFFCTASIRVDFGVATASAPAAGWTAWELPSSNLAPLAISKSFTDDMGTSGNVTVSVTSEAFASYARNNGYNGDGAFSPATPLEFWRDGLFVFGASSKAKAMVITIEGLKAGVYVFTAYAGYRNYGTFESTADIYVNGQYSGLDATTYYRGGVPTAASFLETNIPRKVGFTVANDNDPVSIEFLRLTKEDFGMNGFELNNYNGAYNPYPAVNQQEVAPDVTLQWSIGRDLTDPNNPQPNPSITKHYLYIGENEPNFLYITPIEVSDLTEPIEYGPLSLQKNATYYWRVDESINNSGPEDPNTIQGLVWFFKTETTIPVITQDIEDLWVDPNATAVFDVVFLSNLSPTVRWYKYVDGVSDILLSSGGRYQITTENTGGSNYLSTLEISTIEVSDEGSYYCMLSTNDGEVASASAVLNVKRILSHYPFEGTFEDVIGSYDGTPISTTPTFVDSISSRLGQAASFNGTSYLNIGYGQPRDGTLRNGSVSFWCNVQGQTGTYHETLGTINNGATLGFWAGIEGSYPIFQIRNADGVYPRWTFDIRKPYVPNTWYFFTCTWGIDEIGAMQLKLYIDGLLVRSGIQRDIGIFAWQYPMCLGGSNKRGTFAEGWIGYLDDVKFFNYPLSAAEVFNEYVRITGQEVCLYPPAADLTDDCRVDMDDLAKLADEWLADGKAIVFPD